MSRKGLGGALALALLAAACGGRNIDEGQSIGDVTAPPEDQGKAPQGAITVQKSEAVTPDAERARENYLKLLELPQDPEARAEAMRRLADLQLEQDEQKGASAADTEQHLRQSIALYETVLKEHPDAPGNDRVLYQCARAYQSLGEMAKAETLLQQLTKQYPQSSFADDAHFRRAELLFRLGQYDDAAVEYHEVLAKGADTPFFQPAQYKYGWAQYKQSNYDEAIATFLSILSRELPAGSLADPKAAVEAVGSGKKDMAQDALRVVCLSFAQLGGGDAATKYFAAHGEPPYAPMVYAALGEHLLEKKRYTDSAKAYEAWVNAHPRDPLATVFFSKAIAAQTAGGFTDPLVDEKERYARFFDPSAPYWNGRPATAEVLHELRGHLEDLGRYYQARAQKARDAGSGDPKPDFAAATRWYGRLLELYPQDPKASELRMLRADALLDGGAVAEAAKEYGKVAGDAKFEKAPDAAYAALLAYQRLAKEAPEAGRPAALKQSIQASVQLADHFPQHPQALAVLTRAAEDEYQLKDWPEAAKLAERVLNATPPAPDELRRTALGVTADAHFSQKHYDKAEAAYVQLLQATPADAPGRDEWIEHLASSIYKQGEAARAAKKPMVAADAFLRVRHLAPTASIRATADYDAGAMLIVAKDWPRAAAVLEDFRASNPVSPLLPEVDKKLSVVYTSWGKPKEAAAALLRISARAAETPDARRDAAWLAVNLLDQAKDPRAAASYEAYLKQYPQPFDHAMEARQKLADAAGARGETAHRQQWLRDIVDADTNAGTASTPRTKTLAAQATLELARVDAQKVAKIPLKLPLKQSVPAKKDAMEKAIAGLSKAVDYGIADVTTAATYEMGVLYLGFSKSLLASDRPRNLSALELDQYNVLLEEQAFPFEEKAIQWHETNLQRVGQGIYNPWIGKSMAALAEIAPGKYGKQERKAEVYDGLR